LLRSRVARAPTSTRYGIARPHLVEDLVERASPSYAHIFQPLADGVILFGLGGGVEEALIGGSLLYDERWLAIDRKRNRAPAGPELVEEFGRIVAECGEWKGV
jgi:hypothetical protein